MRRVKQINHETSKAIVAAVTEAGVGIIVLENLTHIRARIKAGKRLRARLHRWRGGNYKRLWNTRSRRQALSAFYSSRCQTTDQPTLSNQEDYGNRER
ncbi:IS200/IS605 family accessory protein TnpB-related protein [Photorhabdus sp. RM323S]|uniref:IS200/IS605 family accessory protein TnpB-related protein n=1 Tax=Photorhabdus sp. RM323S TaxID=3342828 RepID=UPI0036D899E7